MVEASRKSPHRELLRKSPQHKPHMEPSEVITLKDKVINKKKIKYTRKSTAKREPTGKTNRRKLKLYWNLKE